MISVTKLVKRHDRLPVLKGVSLHVEDGEVACVIGPSGGGKSTLLRCINALEPFEEGQIRVGELLLEAQPERRRDPTLRQRLRRQVGMVFQQFHLFPHMTALQNVMSGPLYGLGSDRKAAEADALALLDRVGLANKANAWPRQLSGGQQQRVAIARALAVRPRAILFDEPTSALDPRMAGEVLQVITELARSGQTMVVVTHAIPFARQAARTVHVMVDGVIEESGPAEQVLSDPQQPATRVFLQQAGSSGH